MSSQNSTERRDRARSEIRRLIDDRNLVLSNYYNLAKDSDKADKDLAATRSMLEEFCQHMVDYLAKGHFEIYRRIEEGTERREDITTLASTIMERINVTTQACVDFNDTYDNTEDLDEESLQKLPNHLAKLGEELATRADLEDQFINTLLDEPQNRETEAEPA